MNKKHGAREYEQRECGACGNAYTALVKKYKKGEERDQPVIGDGKCADCLQAERPFHREKCPNCGDDFPVQSGHRRETCSRLCQQIVTRQRRLLTAKDPEPILEQLKVLILRKRKLDSDRDTARKRAEAEREARRTERRTDLAKQKDELRTVRERTHDEITEAFYNTPGSRLERIASVSAAITERRTSHVHESPPV